MRPFLLLLTLVSCEPLVADGPRPWNDYRTILWMGGSVQKNKERWPVMFDRLREMGINTAMVGRDDDPKPYIDAGFGYYVENIINKGLCLKFSSSVTNWSKFIDEWSKTRDEKGFVRDYSFDDSAWRESVFDVMRKAARHHAPFGPVAYDLRDELSVTISANPFDYDFSPTALAGFRVWLKTQYASLEKLNEQWETDFPSWDAVMPLSTDRIKARVVTGERMPKGPPDWSKLKDVKFDPAQAGKNPTRWNFSPWCDHRTYMDISLARTLDDLRKEARKLDPQTPVGIEGTQMASAFGGYDLWRLSQSVDWMEPYDVCNSREILASFMPGKPMMSTVFENDTNAAQRRLWHLLLLGDRGCIVWWSEDAIDWTKPDLPLTAKGQALAPVLKQMTSPLAQLFMLAEKEYDPIAIHYSQPSIQVAWLLESTADGKTWPRRFSSFEATHNRHAQVRNGWLKLLQDAGYSPHFVTGDQIARGELLTAECKIFVLPESSAVGEGEYRNLFLWRDLTHGGGLFATEGCVGRFDQRGKMRSDFEASHISAGVLRTDSDDASLSQIGFLGRRDPFDPNSPFARSISTNSVSHYSASRLSKLRDDELVGRATRVFETKLSPPVRIPPSARVLTHRYKLGTSRLLAFERNIEWKMSEELKQAGGNAELEKPVTFAAEWDEAEEVVDLWTGKRLGKTNKIEVNLDPWRPSLYALLPAPMDGDVIAQLLESARPKSAAQ